jgi:CheY-like chemotaxis protein
MRRILVVEDDPQMGALVERGLQEDGCDLVRAFPSRTLRCIAALQEPPTPFLGTVHRETPPELQAGLDSTDVALAENLSLPNVSSERTPSSGRPSARTRHW